MRYIGGKSLLTDFIGEAITTYAPDTRHVTDIFAGSGAMASYLVNHGYSVTTNDFLYFSYVLCRGTIGLTSRPTFDKLLEAGISDPLGFLNNLTAETSEIAPEEMFITDTYSPAGESGRMYFQEKNARKIDWIRITIERWHTAGLVNDDEYFYLLAALLNAVPFVANITGVYAAYLKHWDARTFKDLTLLQPALPSAFGRCDCHNVDYRTFTDNASDLTYADPPYNQREYCPNYHILETIARYDYPQVHGVTGLRDYTDQHSPFCSRKTVAAFEQLIINSSSRYILISYNNEGLLPSDVLAEICTAYAKPGTFRLLETPYRRYKNKIPNNAAGLKEQLFFIEKEL